MDRATASAVSPEPWWPTATTGPGSRFVLGRSGFSRVTTPTWESTGRTEYELVDGSSMRCSMSGRAAVNARNRPNCMFSQRSIGP